MKFHTLRNNVFWFEANSWPDPLPRSSCLHFSTSLHRCYTDVNDRLLRSILKRKCNHLPIEQALERDGDGEKAHTHSYVNMLQQEERVFKCCKQRCRVVQGVGESEGGSWKDTAGRLGACEEMLVVTPPAWGVLSSSGILCVYVREEKQNRLLISGQMAVRW